MTLLFNTYITDIPANQFNTILRENRGNLESVANLDVVKYSLASLAKFYPWQNVIINIELDSKIYSEADNESLRDFVHTEFVDIPGGIKYSSKRNKSQSDWAEDAHNIQSNLVLYLGNHDHIFIDSDTTYIHKLIEHVRNSDIRYASIVCSHWQFNGF